MLELQTTETRCHLSGSTPITCVVMEFNPIERNFIKI